MQTDKNAPPLNPLPWIVWALALPIIAVEITVSLGASGLIGGPQAIGWRLDAVERFAFAPDILRQALTAGLWWDEALKRLLTYPLVHYSFIHAAFSIVMLLALGKWVGEVFRPWAVAFVFFGASVTGAVVYAALPMAGSALVGASTGVYGLVGAFTFLLWVRLARSGGPQGQAFTLIGLLMGTQLLFRALFGGGWEWVADLMGFAAGFTLSFIAAPGGWARMMARLRQR